MTAIVGIKDNDKVWIASESQGTSGWLKHFRTQEKIVSVGSFLIANAGPSMAGQHIRFSEELANLVPTGDPYRFMIKQFLPVYKNIISKCRDREEIAVMVAWGSNLFNIETDLDIHSSREGYEALGCARVACIGSLYSTEGQTPEARAVKAIEAAIHFVPGCGGKIVVRHT